MDFEGKETVLLFRFMAGLWACLAAFAGYLFIQHPGGSVPGEAPLFAFGLAAIIFFFDFWDWTMTTPGKKIQSLHKTAALILLFVAFFLLLKALAVLLFVVGRP
jgi:hypothetical protein